MLIFRNFANLRDDRWYHYIASLFLSVVSSKVDYAFSCFWHCVSSVKLPNHIYFPFWKKYFYWFVGIWMGSNFMMVQILPLGLLLFFEVCLWSYLPRDVLNLWVFKSVTFNVLYILCFVYKKILQDYNVTTLNFVLITF